MSDRDVAITGRADDPPVIASGHDYLTVTARISNVVLERPLTRGWMLGFAAVFSGTMLLLVALTWLILRGVGIWGINVPVGWGFDIINFVWWIGIGHAGTLISAILLLLRQDWRASINRFAEAVTLFALACAAIFPVFHLGRPWLAYWMLPYPNTLKMWPQPRSPLFWDVFAVATYGMVSLTFWYFGLIPDLATLRDRARRRWQRRFYGVLALGWRGSARHWLRYEISYLMLAGLAAPLVISVHTVVSFDFAVAQVHGWHLTILPPYFVAGAIHSGLAMLMCLAIPVRHFYGLKDFITMRHLQNMARIMIATSWMVAYGSVMEIFMAQYSADAALRYVVFNRFTGPYAPLYYAMWLSNILAPQLFWSKKIRSNTVALFLISLAVNLGMWLERFIIVVTSLHREYIPSQWGMYYPTFWDYATLVGTIGLFLTMMFLFLRVLPAIAIADIRVMVPPPTPGGESHPVVLETR